MLTKGCIFICKKQLYEFFHLKGFSRFHQFMESWLLHVHTWLKRFSALRVISFVVVYACINIGYSTFFHDRARGEAIQLFFWFLEHYYISSHQFVDVPSGNLTINLDAKYIVTGIVYTAMSSPPSEKLDQFCIKYMSGGTSRNYNDDVTASDPTVSYY